MPRYEYQCDECGVRFEHVQSFNDAPLTDCPECHGSLHRLIGPVGVVFKGKGFYVNDSKRESSSSNKD
jgi:putative FmdB family regulatory protein